MQSVTGSIKWMASCLTSPEVILLIRQNVSEPGSHLVIQDMNQPSSC